MKDRARKAFDASRHWVRRFVFAAFAALAFYAFAGVPGLVLLGLAGIAVVAHALLAPPAVEWEPTPEQLAAIDNARGDDEEQDYVDSGAGDIAYEQVLRYLQGLVGSDVMVLIGGGGAAWRAKATLVGQLGTARDRSRDPGRELLFFEVGAVPGNGFFLDRERFTNGRTKYRHDQREGVELVDVDGDVLWILEGVRAHA